MIAALLITSAASADDTTVQVEVQLVDPAATRGHQCSAWPSAEGFRTDVATAAATATSVKKDGRWSCTLTLPRSGTYAVAVMDDANGNGKLDTSWLGAPTEGWGVSRNAKPAMRAPRFDECAVELKPGTTLSIEIRR